MLICEESSLNNFNPLELLFLNVFLEQLGLPIPSTPALIIAGASIYQGTLPAGPALLLVFIAAMIPNIVWYYAGRYYGQRMMGLLCKLSLTPESCVRETTSTFTKWGALSLLGAKFIPGLATIAPPVSGAMKIPVLKFFVFNSLGAMLWIMTSIMVGYVFHHAVEDVLAYMVSIGSVAIPVVLGVLALVIAYKWWSRKKFMKTIQMERITVAELVELKRSGAKYSVLEIRNDPSSEAASIEGAKIVSFQDIDEGKVQIDSNEEIITYCHCPEEASAAVAANKLKDKGHPKARPLKGGAEAWNKTHHLDAMRIVS